jgi:hypothetical protein
MKPLLAIAVAISLLAQAAPVMAQQGGDPFGPLAPSEPTAPPEAPEPAEPPSEDDDDLGMAASLGLAAIAAVLIGAVFVAVTREGRRMDRKTRQAHRGRKAGRGARPSDLHRRSTTAGRAGGGGDRRSDGKRPPPPPRKRRPKSKRR